MFPIFYTDRFLDHDTGHDHPECAARLIAIKTALERSTFANQLEWLLPTPIEVRPVNDLLLLAHTAQHIARVTEFAATGVSEFESTPVSAASDDVARLALNAWIDGVNEVMAKNRPAFVLARPPGHHALPSEGMGFCLFANAAIAAIYAVEHLGLSRVSILDWDVHHGNGTQAIVEKHSKIRYCSLHQFPAYPMTGAASETGEFGNILNVPLQPGSGADVYNAAFELQVLPWLRSGDPQLLIISAGYDAMAVDPLARMRLNADDYGQFAKWCLEITPRILFGLEGGYDLDGLAMAVVKTIETCLN
ncbi:MAG: histone deacetylase [Alkalinema sp. CAN_BIN05]|nr:histone deacetylase [Alkalinema sp. CAN_BIN05]